VKNTFPLDFTIFKTRVCSGDNATPDASVTGDSPTWVYGGLLGFEGPEAVGIGLLLGSGGRIGAMGIR
jgi:hypothetical protein